MKGAPIVVLKEGQADTRARWTANTTTLSDYVPGSRMPALEPMFKAEGNKLETKLQDRISACGYPLG